MPRFTRFVVPALLAVAAGSTFAYAQATQPAPRNRPTAQSLERLEDGRIAMAKTALKMTDAQLTLWAPVETQLRAEQAARLAARQQAEGLRASGATRLTLPERLDRMSTALAQRADRMKALTVVFKPFYESLNEQQKAVVGPLLAELNGGARMNERRMAADHRHEAVRR